MNTHQRFGVIKKMISHLPYKNKLVYMLQTKLQCELPANILHDIDCTLNDYGRKCVEVSEVEKEYWKGKVLNT
jgi:hypothetical protein